MQIKANSKGQVTIPAEIRGQLGITHGTLLRLEVDPMAGRTILTPITREYFHCLRGKHKGKGLMKAWLTGKER